MVMAACAEYAESKVARVSHREVKRRMSVLLTVEKEGQGVSGKPLFGVNAAMNF